MDQDDQVDWQLLPQNPQRFFGLGDQFDRRELKRAYGKLIRRFKPETHPAEFQRIRAAYEELESDLRYGQSHQHAANLNQAWDIAVPAPTDEPEQGEPTEPVRSDPETSLPPPQTVVERGLENPASTYQSLVAKSDRTPQEFYVLAVLSDLVNPADPQQTFFHWLCKGLRSHPEDHGLQSLVQQFVRLSVSLEDAPAILQEVALATRSPAFYWISESLWEKLLRERDFAGFEKLWTRCEAEIQRTDDNARNAFFVRILRTAIWKAPQRWTDAKIDELESQASTLQPYLLQELEFVSLIRDHLWNTSEALSSYQARGRLRRFLYDFCTSDGPAATVAMTAELSQLAREANSMRAAFPVLSERDETPLYMLTYLATDELQQSCGIGFGGVDEHQNNLLARTLLDDLKPSQPTIISALNTISFRYRWLTFFVGLPIATMIGIFCFLFVMASLQVDGPVPVLLMLGFPIAYVVAHFMWIYPKYLEPRVDVAQGRQWWRLYEEHWRERVFRYIQSCNEPPSEALERVVAMGTVKRQEDWANLVQRFATNDIGLLIFGQAQAFVV